MIAERRAGLPELVQFAGQAAGGADHDVARRAGALQGAEHLGVGRRERVGRGAIALRGRQPLRLALRRRFAPFGGRRPVAERRVERRDAEPRVAHQGQRAMLGGVERLDVEADEAALGILEQRPGAGGEVGEARADASTTSASSARALAAPVPVTPIAPRCRG